MRIRQFLSVFLLLLLLTACGGEEKQTMPPPSLTLVESVPVETDLDSPDIPQTEDIWLEMINGAERTLDIAQFYIADSAGQALEPMIDAVIAAGARGVQIRILAEKKFEEVYPNTLLRLRQAPGADVRIYDVSEISGGVHHAKYFIVDGRMVFVGSQNWDWRALTHINELGIRIRSMPVAAAFSQVFNFDWELAGGADIGEAAVAVGVFTESFPVIIEDSLGRHEITPVFSPHDLLPDGVIWDQDELQALMRDAKESIRIALLSYRTYAPLEEELLEAAKRGVQVHLLVSDWSLNPAQQQDLKKLQETENVTVKISSIPEHSSGFITFARVEHCKYMLVDSDWAWIGTSNWSRDYFLASRNAGVILKSAAYVSILHDKYDRSWNGPYVTVMDPETSYEPRRRDDGSGT